MMRGFSADRINRAGIPRDLEEAVVRCLAKEPHERFASVDSLEEALARCQAANGWSQASAADWWRELEPEMASVDVADERPL